MNEFHEYLAHGWKLCRIEPGTKGPRAKGWNLRENAVKSAHELKAAGLMHAYSGTCALDIDRLDDAMIFMQEHGIDLYDLLMAPDAVRINSGQKNRGKLIYALPQPLPSKSFAEGAFELRCGTSGGKTAQDVLPPSPHPSGTTYRWDGDWKSLPPLPEALRALWTAPENSATGSDNTRHGERNSQAVNELRDLLTRRDPSCGYDEWIKIGMALNHESEGSDDGFAIWDEWSASSDKYPGTASLRSHWVSFGRSANPVTADSLRRTDVATVEEFDVLGAETFGGTTEKAPSVYKWLGLRELFDRPKPKWIVEGLLPQVGLGAIWGQSGSGKTFVAIDLALAIALGSPWRGQKVQQGEVLYIAAEDDTGVQIRFEAAIAAKGSENAPIRVLPTAPVFTSPKEATALLESIKPFGPQSLVFVDTLAAVTPGADENTSKDMGMLIQFCQKIQKKTGGLVLLIHHEGKTPGRGMRGSSALPAALEVALEVSEDEGRREVRISKMKNAPKESSYEFQLLPCGDSCTVEWLQ